MRWFLSRVCLQMDVPPHFLRLPELALAKKRVLIVGAAVIHLTRVAGVTCHAEPSLLTLRSLPERQPAGPFGKRSFVT